jgi:hypothetical protein
MTRDHLLNKSFMHQNSSNDHPSSSIVSISISPPKNRSNCQIFLICRAVELPVFFLLITIISYIYHILENKQHTKNKRTQEFISGKPQMGEKPSQPFLDRFRPS